MTPADVEPVSGVTSFRVAVWLGAFLLFCFSYFLPHWDWNQTARLDMTVAIVNHGTFAIDRYQANTGDKDLYRGHYYALKAPGQSIIGVPFYLAYKGFRALEGSHAADTADDLAAQDLEILATCTIPLVLLLLLFFWFLGYFSTSLGNRALLTLTLGLGTNFFAYGQQLFGHVPAAALLLTGFVLVYILAHPQLIRGPWTAWLIGHPGLTAILAGLALGAAVFIEFPPALIALLIGIYALMRLPLRLVVYVALGAIPPLLLLGFYDFAVYGNPLTLGYTSGASSLFRGTQSPGLGGVVWPPKLAAVYGLSFDPYRGLFFLSPFLLLALPGYLLWRRGGLERLLFLAIPLLFFVTITMYTGWWGGLAVGPRLLIPMLPFLAIPIIFALDRAQTWSAPFISQPIVYGLIAGHIAISIANTWVQTIGGTNILYPPENNHNPLFTYSLPAFLHGQVFLNRGMDFGLSGLASLAPLFLVLALWSLLVFAPIRNIRGIRVRLPA